MNVLNVPVFMTVNKTAKLGFISHCKLRQMVAAGECPGYRSGNRFMVNVDALVEKLAAGATHKGAN